jgi:hypothetical protein
MVTGTLPFDITDAFSAGAIIAVCPSRFLQYSHAGHTNFSRPRVSVCLSLGSMHCSDLVQSDLDSAAPDVRDMASESVRSSLSTAFAEVLANGLKRRAFLRIQTADDLSSDL